MNDRRKIYVNCNTYDSEGDLKIEGKRKISLKDGTILYYNSEEEDLLQDTHEITLYSGENI